MRIDPSFEQMYRAEYGSVFRAVYLLCGDQAMAEDATQEAFARALERWRRLEGRSWAAGWVVTTALNISRRALRRRPEPVLVEKNPSPDPDELLDLRMAVHSLPRRQQEAVVLHYLSDLPVEDVARAMGTAPGTVKAHLNRAREAIASKLAGRVS
jgi:RNA polymerase sigma-70 factor (ECF subfamily)